MVPTLNEVEGMKAIMPKIDPSWYDELIVIDGGSTDGTLDYCREKGYRVVHQQSKTIANAYTEAFAESRGDFVVLFTPDGNSDPDTVPKIVAKMREGYDMVIASRYLGGHASEDDDAVTALGNRVFTTLVNLLFGARLTDSLVAFRAFSRKAILDMKLPSQTGENALRRRYPLMCTWELGSSIRSAKLSLRVTEIYGPEPPRIGGERKMSVIRNGIGCLLQILEERVRGNGVFY
ncbi:MAG: glycosyltransferase family 2 protein [Rhodospirillales bacterium]|nr:MAG: glycosyltransferase family 2 protein [Rhodospirillales bacterium]